MVGKRECLSNLLINVMFTLFTYGIAVGFPTGSLLHYGVSYSQKVRLISVPAVPMPYSPKCRARLNRTGADSASHFSFLPWQSLRLEKILRRPEHRRRQRRGLPKSPRLPLLLFTNDHGASSRTWLDYLPSIVLGTPASHSRRQSRLRRPRVPSTMPRCLQNELRRG